MATRAISHTPHQVVNPSPRSDTPPHFCKDCDVMFESSTSLKVHLSYHKENLLSRWTNPDVNSSTIMESNNKNSQPPTPISPADNNGNGPPPTSIPTYFHPDHGLGLYLPAQYNNNTGDRSGDPHVNYRPIPNFEHHPHPYASANGIPTTMPSNNVQEQHQYSSNTQQQQQQQLFSPNNPSGGDPPRPGSNASSVAIKQERSEETPAEILDLDSHKVHVYQLPLQQQQQQQQLDSLSRNNFYRPYLPHLLPAPPGNPNNGWPHPHDQFSPNFQPDHHPGMGIPHPHPYGHGIPPPPQPGSGNIVYELVREDGHRGGGVGYAPSESVPLQPPMGYSPQLGPLPPSFRGQFPPNIPPQETSGPLMTSGNPARGTPPPPRKSPPTPSGGTGKKNANSASAANANGAPAKTKGWKGGECKRPKTYNCTACNKWFTSSGHLKRHYGTTLHKNSLKQKGENPEDPQHQQPTGRKTTKKSPGDKMTKGGPESNHSHSMEGITAGNLPSPSRISIKHEDSTSSGKSTPPNFNNNNNNGRGGDFNNVDDGPPSNIPNYVNVTNQYLPYNCVQPGPPLHSQYVLQNHFPSPGHGVPFSNGFIPDSGGGPPIGGIYSAVPASIVPTSIYNGGYSVITTANCEPSLPPFSSVGFSHYDPNSFAHMTTTAALQQHGNPFPPPPQNNNLPQSGSPSPQGQGSQRMTPNGPQYQQTGPGSLSSPRSNSSSSGLLEAFGSDMRNNSSNSLNRNSPEAVRSASTASGSMEGSLDGMSRAGSPVQSLSDMSSGPDSLKGDILESDSPGSGGVIENPPALLKCSECSKTFGRSCYLTQHTNSSHSGGKPFKCSTCGKRFPEEPALSDHFAKHGSDKPYKCSLCPKQFNHKTDLRRHLCLHTGKKPFECNICGKGFIRKDHMAKHTETHRKQHNSNKTKRTEHTNNTNSVLSYIDNV